MSHLLKEYQNSLGVSAEKPIINKHFYPITCEKFIVFYNDGLNSDKFYHHYDLVLGLIYDFVVDNDIKIVFIGEDQGCPMQADIILSNLTFRQSCYVISKASVLISSDNSLSHYASSVGVPIVNLISKNYPSVTKPFWSTDNKNSINISPKWSVKPYLVTKDMEDSVNTIPAESVANSVIGLISKWTAKKLKFKTKQTNSIKSPKADVIPSCVIDPPLLKEFEYLNVRLDLLNEDLDSKALLPLLERHKCTLFIKDNLINIDPLIPYASNIEKVCLLLNQEPPQIEDSYFEKLRRLNIDFEFLVEDKSILDKVRLDYFEQMVSFEEKEIKKPKNISKEDKFLSCRFVIDGNKVYHSMAHWKKGLDNNVNIVDNDDFWEESNYFYIYED